MDFKRFSGLILLLALALAQVLGEDNGLTVEMDSFEILKNYDRKFIEFKSLQMRKAARNQFKINGTYILNMNLGNEQKLNLQLYQYDMERKQRGLLIYNADYEVCNFIVDNTRIYQGLKEASNMPEPGVCPIPKGEYNIKDFEVSADAIPENTPKGDYLAVAKLKDGLRVVSTVELYVTIS